MKWQNIVKRLAGVLLEIAGITWLTATAFSYNIIEVIAGMSYPVVATIIYWLVGLTGATLLLSRIKGLKQMLAKIPVINLLQKPD